MHYTDIENFIDDDTSIHWRNRRGHVQLRCPKCDMFFNLPNDITIDSNGYCSTSVYHFCEDVYSGEENNDGWCILPHLVGWSVK